jgi:signal transduction histidine kinase
MAASGTPVRNHLLEGELPTRPGEHRFWNVSYSPVFNADGKVEAIAAVILEITNQKKAEAALIQSEKLAAVGRLASSISHEINNPLEAITNLLYLIDLSSELPESLRGYVHTAQNELSRVCQIATQTLRFHRQAVRATDINAEDLVSAVLNLYQGRLSNSHIKVEARYATTTSVLCFENDIRQVLNNLIANAIDAMRQGGRLIVRAHDAMHYSAENLDGRRGIRITIADTGHGMSSTVQSRLFEPFYTTKDLNGTGLGLWISAGIVSRHHGHITFRSSQAPAHRGTVFSLFLPCVEIQTSETQSV